MPLERRIIDFLAEFTGSSVGRINLDTLVNEDLGVDGDDGAELLAEFSQVFDVDMSSCSKTYFGPEGFSPLVPFYAVREIVGGFFGWPKLFPLDPLPIRTLVHSAEAGTWSDT